MSADKTNIVFENCSGAPGASINSRWILADMNQKKPESSEPHEAKKIISFQITFFNARPPI